MEGLALRNAKQTFGKGQQRQSLVLQYPAFVSKAKRRKQPALGTTKEFHSPQVLVLLGDNTGRTNAKKCSGIYREYPVLFVVFPWHSAKNALIGGKLYFNIGQLAVFAKDAIDP